MSRQPEADRENNGLKLAALIATEFCDALNSAPVQSTATIEELRWQFAKELPPLGMKPEKVVRHLSRAVEGGLVGSASGRFFAWVIGGSLESALAADWLTAAWDQNAALSACSPAAAVAEEVVGRWLTDLLRLPAGSSFALTTGCQMAHMTCLAAARNAVLNAVGWDVETKGLCGSPAITVLCNEHRHGSIDKAIRLLGFGSDSLLPVGTNSDGQIRPEAFKEAQATTNGPMVAVLNAGDINTGCFDRFDELISVARQHGTWCHIDGAFGLFANASGAKRHLLSGVELADSWATDGHKWLNVPFDCGFAFVRNKEAHRASMTTGGSYVSTSRQVRDQIDWNPEWSRRARGFPVYAALLELGRSGVEELVDRCCRLALLLVDGLRKLPRTEVLCRPILNQGMVRFHSSVSAASELDHDRETDAMIAAINSTGETFFSGTTWQGQRAMRVSLVNWQTNEIDIDRAISVVERLVCDRGRTT